MVTLSATKKRQASVAAWRYLVAESVPNVYLLENGVNGWLHRFGNHMPMFATAHGSDQLGWKLQHALGDRWPAALPDPSHYQLAFDPKIKLELKRGPTNDGCG